jgi:hypothetical protein
VDERLKGWAAQFIEEGGGPGIQDIAIVNWVQSSGVITPYVDRDGEEVRLSEFEEWFEGWRFGSFVKEGVSFERVPDPVEQFFARMPKLDS